MIKQSKLIADLKELANGKSMYRNAYPYNLLYWDGTRFWADCVNLYKALFNGRDIKNKTVGSFQSDLNITDDCTEWGLLSKCKDVSTDFSKLKKGEFRCLYHDGHFGGYLGEELVDTATGGIVNCVESTPAWLNGIQFSYVDENGYRRQYKGATARSRWTHHGRPDAFVQNDGVQPQPTPSEDFSIKAWQTAAKADGLYTGEIDGSFGPLSLKAASEGVLYGCKHKNLVVFWQKWLKAKGYFNGNVDGLFGIVTKGAVVKAQAAYGIGQDGSIGPVSTKAFLGIK